MSGIGNSSALNGFGPMNVDNDIRNEIIGNDEIRPEHGAEELVRGEGAEAAAPRESIDAHASFVNHLFEKAIELNKDSITLTKAELKAVRNGEGQPLEKKTAAAAEKARAAAQSAMKTLDKYTGRQLVAALRGRDFANSKAGKAFFGAIETQMTLAKRLSECSAASGGVGELDRMAMQANLRAAELSRLLGELDQAEETDGRLARKGLSSELSRIGAEDAGNRAVLAFLEHDLGLAQFEAFVDDGKDMGPDKVAELRVTLGELRGKIEEARTNGIEMTGPGKGRTMVDPAVFKALCDELDAISQRLDKCDAKFVAAELDKLVEEIRVPPLVTECYELSKSWKLSKSVRKELDDAYELMTATYDKAMREDVRKYFRDCLAEGRSPDAVKVKEMREAIADAGKKVIYDFCRKAYNANYGRLPQRQMDFFRKDIDRWLFMKTAMQRNIGNLVLTTHSSVVDVLAKTVRHWQRSKETLSLRKDDVRALLTGEVKINDHIEARIHGFGNAAVDTKVSGYQPDSVEPLGSGQSSTAFLCAFGRDGGTVEERVFKPESSAHFSLNDGVRHVFHGKVNFQCALAFNMASHAMARMLGAKERNVETKIGTLDGQFGMFMEVAPGVSPKEVVRNGKTHLGGEEDACVDEIARGLRSENAETKAKTLSVTAKVARELNELQWIDILTGQLDRHNGNYHVYVPSDLNADNVRVTGIDNDASFGDIGTEIGTYHVSNEVHSRLKNRPFEQYATKKDDDSGWVYDTTAMNDAELTDFAWRTGIRCNVRLPTVIDRVQADKIAYLATDDGMSEFERELEASGLTPEQIAAAKIRLESANRYVNVDKKVQILDGDAAWSDLAETRMIASPDMPLTVNAENPMAANDYFMRADVLQVFNGPGKTDEAAKTIVFTGP